MKKIRNSIFETNSSSTHSLVFMNEEEKPKRNNKPTELKVKFINTDENPVFVTVKEKLNYLVNHIVAKYNYWADDYGDLIDQVRDDYDFKRLSEYALYVYNINITFPKTHKKNLEEIVNINHQLRESTLDDVLSDLISIYDFNEKLSYILDDNKKIVTGHD